MFPRVEDNLDDTIWSDFCSSCSSRHAKFVYNLLYITSSSHVSKCYDILRAVRDNRKEAVGLINTRD